MARLPTFENVEAGGRPLGTPSGQVLGGRNPKPADIGGAYASPEVNRLLNPNKTGLQVPMGPKATPGSAASQGNTPAGLSVPEVSGNPVDDIKAELQVKAKLGAGPFIQSMMKVDPDTAEAQQNALIRQKSSLMRGKQDTAEMNPQEFGEYLKNTKKLSDLATDVQSVSPQERAVRYQQRLDKIRALDPNAPERYDANYMAVAALEGNPIKTAMTDNAQLKQMFDEPLTKRQVEQVSPGASKLMGDAGAKLIMANNAGNYKAFETTDKNGKKVIVVDDNGKIKKLGDDLNVASGLDPKVMADAKARRSAALSANKKEEPYTPKQKLLLGVINDKTKSDEERSAAGQIFTSEITASIQEQKARAEHQANLELELFKSQIEAAKNGSEGDELNKATANLLEKDIVKNNEILMQFDNLFANMDDATINKYMTVQGKGRTALAEGYSATGNEDASFGLKGISAKEWLDTRSKISTPAFLIFQTFRSKFTGQSASDQEIRRLSTELLDANGMDPATFRAKAKRLRELVSDANKLAYKTVKSNKLPNPWDPNSTSTAAPGSNAVATVVPGQSSDFDVNAYGPEDIPEDQR